MTKKFAVSGQHYLFDVQSFAAVVLSLGGDAYAYALRDRTTKRVIEDVASGEERTGRAVSRPRARRPTALEEACAGRAGVEFVELIESAPRVALPKSHPFVNAAIAHASKTWRTFRISTSSRRRERRSHFAEEALADVPRVTRASPARTARRFPSSSSHSTAIR